MEDNTPYTPLSVESISKIAKDVALGKIFISWMCPEDLLINVFMPLALIEDKRRQWFIDNEIHGLYEYYEKSIKLCVNGYPIFPSFHILNKHDYGLVYNKFTEIDAAIKAI